MPLRSVEHVDTACECCVFCWIWYAVLWFDLHYYYYYYYYYHYYHYVLFHVLRTARLAYPGSPHRHRANRLAR
jgi:hypothetical protein